MLEILKSNHLKLLNTVVHKDGIKHNVLYSWQIKRILSKHNWLIWLKLLIYAYKQN